MILNSTNLFLNSANLLLKIHIPHSTELFEFINSIKKLHIPNDHVILFLVVTSPFTNVPNCLCSIEANWKKLKKIVIYLGMK